MDWDWLLPVSLLELLLWVFKFLWSGREYGENKNSVARYNGMIK